MGKIIDYKLLNFQKGGGKVNSIVNDFSGSKKSYRLVYLLKLKFDDSSIKKVIIKIAPVKNNPETIGTNDRCLKNAYIHENLIYKFFKEKSSTDSIIDKYILKSLDSDVNNKGTFTINDENFNFLEDSIIEATIDQHFDWDNSHSDSESESNYDGYSDSYQYTYNVTEYNSDVISYNEWLESRPPIVKRKKFIVKTIQILEYLHKNYNFCHHDFHFGNQLVNKKTANPVIFDFDFSIIDHYSLPKELKFSKYEIYVPFFLGSFHYLAEIYPKLRYETIKFNLVHCYDLIHFYLTPIRELIPNISDDKIPLDDFILSSKDNLLSELNNIFVIFSELRRVNSTRNNIINDLLLKVTRIFINLKEIKGKKFNSCKKFIIDTDFSLLEVNIKASFMSTTKTNLTNLIRENSLNITDTKIINFMVKALIITNKLTNSSLENILDSYFSYIVSATILFFNFIDLKFNNQSFSVRTRKDGTSYYYNDEKKYSLPDYIHDYNQIFYNIENTFQLCEESNELPPNWDFVPESKKKNYINLANGIITDHKPSVLEKK